MNNDIPSRDNERNEQKNATEGSAEPASTPVQEPGKTENKAEDDTRDEDIFNTPRSPETPVKTTHIHADLRVENNGNTRHQSNDININFYSDPKDEQIEFDLYERKTTTEYDSLYISNDVIAAFLKSRILVVNTDHGELASAVIDQVLWDIHVQHNDRPLCCTLETQRPARLRDITNALKKRERTSKKSQVIVIYEKREDAGVQQDFLKVIREKGGAANAVSQVLSTLNAYIIYSCTNDQLQDAATGYTHFALYNILYTEVVLSRHITNRDLVRTYARKINQISKSTGWLADMPENERDSELIRLVTEKSLHEELKQKEKDIDIAQDTLDITTMLQDPLKNIILFVAAFFENVSISDFHNIVNILVSYRLGSTDTRRTNEWKLQPDVLIDQCGIASPVVNGRYTSYGFSKRPVRKTICEQQLTSMYRIELAERFKVLQNQFLTAAAALPLQILEGISRICFLCARNESESSGRYLTNVCMSIVGYVEKIHKNDQIRNAHEAFFRLLFIIREWAQSANDSKSIARFYDQMKGPIKREILMAIFTNICAPEYPHNITRLRILLEETEEKDSEPFLDTIHQIFNNHLDSIFDILRKIDAWNDSRTPKAFAYAKSSFLKLFYKNWDKSIVISDLEYDLADHILAEDPVINIEILAQFIFDKNNLSAFSFTYKHYHTDINKNEKQVLRLLGEDLLLRYGFICIHVYEVLILIDKQDTASGDRAEEMICLFLQTFAGIHDTLTVKRSLSKATAFYKSAIQNLPAEEAKSKAILINKRGLGYQVQKLIPTGQLHA